MQQSNYEGNRPRIIETPMANGQTPYDPELAAQMEIAERVMREDRDVLKKLGQ